MEQLSGYINPKDREWAERTVELWEMEDREWIISITSHNLRSIVSSDLKKTYGVDGRFPSTLHIRFPVPYEFG